MGRASSEEELDKRKGQFGPSVNDPFFKANLSCLIFSPLLWLDRNFLIFQRDFFFFFLAVVEHSSQTLPHKLRSFVFLLQRGISR